MKTPTLALSLIPLLLPLAQAYTGDMTYYTPGLGSCGYTSSSSDAIVALSTTIMNNGANPNANPICGSTISIYNPNTGTTHTATIVDTCEGCAEYDIDVSPSLFSAVAPSGDGRVHGIDWGGSKVGGKKMRVVRGVEGRGSLKGTVLERRDGYNGTV